MSKTSLLAEKVCLVTGGNRGIGKSIVETFLANEAIVYTIVRKRDSMAELKEKYNQSEERLIENCFDITDYTRQLDAVAQIRRDAGQLDVVVNNAAISMNEAFGMITPDSVRQMFEVNVIAPMQLSQLSARIMMRKHKGSIINISSIVGLKGDEGQVAYSASKGAVISMTKSMAKELGKYNIRVNSVAPGLTNTEMYTAVEEEKMRHRISNIKMERISTPQDIANACLFLASDLSSYISGQILGVDGCSVL